MWRGKLSWLLMSWFWGGPFKKWTEWTLVPCSIQLVNLMSWQRLLVMFGLHFTTQTRWTASFTFSFPSLHWSPCTIWPSLTLVYDTIWSCSCVRYDLVFFLCTIWSDGVLMYDINLRAMHTTILSIRGVTIPIYLVSSATDSIRRSIVLFKLVTIPTSDPKSEFLCQSSSCCAEPTDPLNTSYAWDISHALITTYHL